MSLCMYKKGPCLTCFSYRLTGITTEVPSLGLPTKHVLWNGNFWLVCKQTDWLHVIEKTRIVSVAVEISICCLSVKELRVFFCFFSVSSPKSQQQYNFFVSREFQLPLSFQLQPAKHFYSHRKFSFTRHQHSIDVIWLISIYNTRKKNTTIQSILFVVHNLILPFDCVELTDFFPRMFCVGWIVIVFGRIRFGQPQRCFFLKVEGVSLTSDPQYFLQWRFMFTTVKNFLLSSKFLPPTTQSFLKGYYFTEIGKIEITFFKNN